MKHAITGIIILFVLCCLVQAGTAFKIESNEVTPAGDLAAGTAVTAHVVVDFSTLTGTTFPTADSFQAFTELDKAKWHYSVSINGAENPKPDTTGKYLKINGFDLEYPASESVKLLITMEGVVPPINATQNITIMRLQWLDQANKVRENGEFSLLRKVVNPDDLVKSVQQAQTDLKTLRTHIDQQAAAGVATDEAEAKYRVADQAIRSANGANFTATQANLDTAQTAIADAEISLDKSAAQGEIDQAKNTIANVDQLITYFKTTGNMANDPRVAAITIQRENADQAYIAANDSLTAGNYNQAQIKANESARKALAAYNDALALRNGTSTTNTTQNNSSTENGGGGLGILSYILVIVVIGLIVGGVILYQRRNRWDELG
jgi:hypothetical protein